MNKKMLTDYLSFTRKERNAVLVLVVLIILIFILPYYMPKSKKAPYEELMAIDTAGSFTVDVQEEDAERNYEHYGDKKRGINQTGKNIQLFYFNPNTLPASGWLELGLKERTISTIQKFISKGGKFKDGNDLKKIFGLSRELAEKLIPYVSIPASEKHLSYATAVPVKYPEKKAASKLPIDINTADSMNLLELNGIGPALAGRIVKFRDKLGGFVEIKQVREVYGLPDSTFEKIVHRLSLSAVPLKKININDADLSSLRQHPYVGRNLAQVIIQYRQQHGHFNTVEQLSSIDIITPEILKKIAPYLTTNTE